MLDQLKPVYKNLSSVIKGVERTAHLLLTGLLAEGHILIQDAPGLGKTTLVKALAKSIDAKFNRIQFTPDLLPSDILGYNLYHQASLEFKFIEGPIFSNFLLADEINRTSPRVQSALLEAMNEKQVSIDGKTYSLESPFIVIATQNNVYSTGTFPLPEPQLDRFSLSFHMGLPSPSMQSQILLNRANVNPLNEIEPVISKDEIVAMQNDVANVSVSEKISDYIVQISEETRKSDKLVAGVSVRASIALLKVSQAFAYLNGRDSVYPDDVKKMVVPVYGHRISIQSLQNKKNVSTVGVLEEILQNVRVP